MGEPLKIESCNREQARLLTNSCSAICGTDPRCHQCSGMLALTASDFSELWW